MKRSKLKLGFNEGINNNVYHGDRKYVSSSVLKCILTNPRKYYNTYILGEEDKKSSAAFDFGSYLHCRILEPHLVEEEFAIFTGKTRRGSVWEEFRDGNTDKIIITNSQKNYVDQLITQFNDTTVVLGDQDNEKEVPLNSFFTNGNAEETLCVKINGVHVKVRFDYRKEWEDFGSINDLKTTMNEVTSPRLAKEVCDMYDYDLSAALYVDAVAKHTGKPHDFYFTFLSKADGRSYIYKASEQMLARGRDKYLRAIELIKIGRKTGIWVSNKIEEIG